MVLAKIKFLGLPDAICPDYHGIDLVTLLCLDRSVSGNDLLICVDAELCSGNLLLGLGICLGNLQNALDLLVFLLPGDQLVPGIGLIDFKFSKFCVQDIAVRSLQFLQIVGSHFQPLRQISHTFLIGNEGRNLLMVGAVL